MPGNDFILIILCEGFKKGQICSHVLCIRGEMDKRKVQLPPYFNPPPLATIFRQLPNITCFTAINFNCPH